MKDKVQILREIFLPICMYASCMFAVKPEYLSRHLKDVHDWDHEEATAVADEVAVEIRSIEATPEQKNRAAIYLGEETAVGAGEEHKLPRLPHLPVHRGYRCPCCHYCATLMDTMRKHMNVKHPQACPSTENSACPVKNVTLQSVFGGGKKRWFEVTFELDDAASKLCPARFIKNYQQGWVADSCTENVSHMNAFLSTVRFDNILNENGISMEKAWELVHEASDGDTAHSRRFRTAMKMYFLEAYRTSKKYPSISSHLVQGVRLRLQLEENTLDRYGCVMKQLLLFSHKLSAEMPELVPVTVRGALSDVQSTSAEEQDLYLRAFHRLASSLFLEVIEPRRGDVGFLGVFVACMNIVGGPSRGSLRYGDAGECTPVLAALKYCVRVIAVLEVAGHGETKTGQESWKYIDARTADRYVDTGATYVAYLSQLAHSIRSSETNQCRFRICREHSMCGIIDGVEIPIVRLGDVVHDIQSAAHTILIKDLLQGLEVGDSFWEEASRLQDALQNRARGFWFGCHPSNTVAMAKWQVALWNHIGSQLWCRETEKLDMVTCTRFLDSCELFQRNILTLLQLTCGAPSRASEIAVTRVVNDSMGTRNLFLCDGQLVLSTFYSKTRSLNDGASKPVARFPDAVTSGLLLLYLAVVRPLEFGVVKSMAAVAGGSLEVDEQRVYLFARRGRSVAGTHLCAWFRETMKENGLENVTVSLYRQYQAGVVKNFFREVEGAETRVMHMQAGHSEDTAHRVYGVSDADFRHLTGTELEAYRSYSQRWHTALGLVHGPPRPYGASLAEKSASGYKEIVATAVENKTDELLHAVLDRLARMEKQMTEVISAKRSDTNTPVKEWEETAAEPSLKRVKISGPGIAEHRQEEDESLALQGALEKFLGASKPESVAFKSPLQRKAVEMVKQRNTDVVVILPTGGGKSLCFMLPCFLETNAVTVLVVPLVALQVDMLDRCTRAGIDAASWSGRERVGVRVVIASVEHVLTDQYRIFVAELVRCGKLSRVVVDEAHLIPMWASFRSSLKSLATFVRPPGITVPVVMLTATAPPALVPLMTEMCGVSRYQVVRAASYRPNISYRVERQPGAAGSITFYMRAAGKVLETIEKYRSDSAHSRVIVYMQTRAAVDTLCSILCCEASTAAYRYHAGMANEDRVRAQKAWADNVDGAERFKVMVATSAFGTGIDYPSIRAVVHVEGARSLLEFIQESGRAGRDGHAAESIVLLAEGGRDSMPASSPDEWKEIMHGDGSPNSHDAALWQISGDFGSYISAETQCRRQLLDSFCDGNREVLCCLRRAEGGIKAVLCDLCEQKRSPGGSSSSDQGKPGAPSFAGKEAADNEKPWAELYHGEQHGISADWTRPDVAKSAEAAQKQRELAEREVSQLRELAARFADVCAVCTVAYSVEVRHSPGRPNETNSDGCAQYLPCQAGRCDRCGLKGHSWMSCKLNAKPERNQGCARCGISKHRGLLVHRDGEFGKRGCSVKNVLSIALLCWEEEKHRQSLKNEFSDLRPVQEIQQYAAWLRCALHGRAGAPLQTGLARIARWLLLSFCRKS